MTKSTHTVVTADRRQWLVLAICLFIGITYLIGDCLTKYKRRDTIRVIQQPSYGIIIDSSSEEDKIENPKTATHVINTTSMDTADDPGLTICSNQVRLDHIAEMCIKYNWTKVPQRRRRLMFVIDKYKLLYCDIPKSGSTSMKTLLGNLVMPPGFRYDMGHYTDDTGYRMFSSLSLGEQEVVMKDYYKIVVVRHPLDRLRSAYKDKVVIDNVVGEAIRRGYEQQIRTYLIEQGQVTNETFEVHRDKLTLGQFFDMLRTNDSKFQNIHWDSYTNLCNPCGIQYDLILKLETIYEDIRGLHDYLISQNSSARLSEMPHTHRHEREVDKLALITNLTSQFSPDITRGLMQLYEPDFIWAGYDWDRKQGAVCKEGNMGCC